MKCTIEISLSRELVQQVLRAYMARSLPSALAGICAETFAVMADDLAARGRHEDAALLSKMASEWARRSEHDRKAEDHHYSM